MSLDVYINDELLELNANAGIGLTFQIGSVLNPGNRAGNLSNKFRVPKTKNNTSILSNLSNINSQTNIPYQRNKAKIVQDGIEIFPDGFAIINSTGKEYSITIYSGNISFFDLIKGKNINDLDWSDSLHKYNITNIIASFTNGEKFIYPIIDWGRGVQLLNNSTLQDADALIPCAYIKEVLEKTALAAGYELKGTFLNTDQYSRLILTPNQFGYSQELLDATNGESADVTVTGEVDTTIDAIGTATGPSEFVPIPITYNTFTQPTFSGVTFSPLSPIYGVLTFAYKVSLRKATGFAIQMKLTAIITEDGVPILTEIFTTTAPTAAPTLNVSISTDVIYLDPNKTYAVEIEAELERDSIDYIFTYNMLESSFSLSMSKNIPINGDMPFEDFFNQDQDKIFKDIMNQYSLTVQTDELRKQVFLNPLNDLISNISIAKDWSSKINLKTIPTTKYKLGEYAQLNYFNYAEDEDVPINTGRGSFAVNDVKLRETKEIMTLNSTGVISGKRLENEITPTIPFMTSVGKAYDQEKSRILLLDPTDKTIDFQTQVDTATGQATTDIPFCYFNKDGKTDNLDFTSLISENYSVLVGMLDQVKFITARFNLTEIDVSNINFTIPIFLDVHISDIHINGYFYMNKISNFKRNKSTAVDLIRL